ncbi:hypothetical protein DPMN_057990 [Dreissena polymorpha]|uniref:C1q domain-containing protein n=1 Tax=Dreissena polymorpha TaxID=45954 RepID=A0A9D4C167_DREPO|nr:hypothetical protein DPMN_057990 [Dreissena polymorpha]
MSTKQMHLGINQNLVFDRVLLNDGSGYYPLHGLFIAPQSGIYMVSSSIMAWNGRALAAEIVKNGNVQARVYAHELSVRSFVKADAKVCGSDYPSFSGYLLWPM